MATELYSDRAVPRGRAAPPPVVLSVFLPLLQPVVSIRAVAIGCEDAPLSSLDGLSRLLVLYDDLVSRLFDVPWWSRIDRDPEREVVGPLSVRESPVAIGLTGADCSCNRHCGATPSH